MRFLEHYGSRTGTYAVSLLFVGSGREMPASNPGLGWIDHGETKTSELRKWSEMETGFFNASSGEVVNIRITPTSTPFRPYVTLIRSRRQSDASVATGDDASRRTWRRA
jgi:hypothetical protein